MESNQPIIGAITNIKVPGIATMSYWSILKTPEAIYIVQSGSALGLGVGTGTVFLLASVLGDALESHKSKKTADKNLSSVLAEAQDYLRFSKDRFVELKIKQGLFGGGSIIVPNGKEKSWREAGYVKLKLSRKKLKLFIQMLQA